MNTPPCLACGRRSYHNVCCDENKPPTPQPRTNPCRTCTELPFCPAASGFITQCDLDEYLIENQPEHQSP